MQQPQAQSATRSASVARGLASLSLTGLLTVAGAVGASAITSLPLPSVALAAPSSAESETWVRTTQPTGLWSGTDANAVRFTTIAAGTRLRLLEAPASAPGWLQVQYDGDGATRQAGRAWVQRGAVAVSAASEPSAQSQPALRGSSAGLSRDAFVQTIGAAAQASDRATGVPASVTVAQAILESNWGQSQLSTRANNLFGIKASRGMPSITMPTWEVLNGKNVTVQAPFRAYNSLQESIDDHAQFFHRNSRYARALAVKADPRAFARAIHAAGYATDPAYADKLITLMDRHNLYRFDV